MMSARKIKIASKIEMVQKSQCQLTFSVITPPRIGPTAGPA